MSEQISDNSQGDTGTHDITYDLVSVVYHAGRVTKQDVYFFGAGYLGSVRSILRRFGF